MRDPFNSGCTPLKEEVAASKKIWEFLDRQVEYQISINPEEEILYRNYFAMDTGDKMHLIYREINWN